MASDDVVNDVVQTKELECQKFGLSLTPVARQSSISDPTSDTTANNAAIDSILVTMFFGDACMSSVERSATGNSLTITRFTIPASRLRLFWRSDINVKYS